MKFETFNTRFMWMHLGYRDLRARYARTKLGTWWSALTLLAVVTGISLSVSLLSGGSVMDVAPRTAVAMAVWTLVSSVLTESADAYVAERGLLLNLSISESIITARLIWRNFLMLLHNSVILVLLIAVSNYPTLESLARLTLVIVVLGPVICLSLYVPALAISRLGAMFPDLRVFVGTAVQLNFFITPVLWDPPSDGVMRNVFLINPLGWYVQLAKDAIFLGRVPSELILLATALLCSMAVLHLVLGPKRRSIKKYL